MFTFFIAGLAVWYGLVTLAVTSGIIETAATIAYHDPIAGVFCLLAGCILFPIGGNRMDRQLS